MRNAGNIVVETVLVENPYPVTGADGVARKQKVLSLKQINHGSVRMARHGDGLYLHSAQVEDLSLADEGALRLREAVRQATEVPLRQGEAYLRILHEGWNHSRMVPVVVGESDGKRLVSNALCNKALQGFCGIIGPVDGIGKVYDKGFLLTHQQIDVRAVVEVRKLSVGIKSFAGGVAAVIILDVVHVFADDGNGVGAHLNVFYSVAGKCKRGGESGGEKDSGVHKELRLLFLSKDTKKLRNCAFFRTFKA